MDLEKIIKGIFESEQGNKDSEIWTDLTFYEKK